MKEGYYFYQVRNYKGHISKGANQICWVYRGYVHFFGQVSQKIGNEYLTEYVVFGDMINTEKEEVNP